MTYDSSTIRKIIIRSLAAVGVPDAVEAADGNEALSHFQQNDFDLVLTDRNMPGKDGLEPLKDVKALKPDVPVIVITTEAEKRRVTEAIAAGVHDYLVKPFTPDALREKIDSIVAAQA